MESQAKITRLLNATLPRCVEKEKVTWSKNDVNKFLE
jgi:hypothetical protein